MKRGDAGWLYRLARSGLEFGGSDGMVIFTPREARVYVILRCTPWGTGQLARWLRRPIVLATLIGLEPKLMAVRCLTPRRKVAP